MKPYNTLTPRGKAARLRPLAWQALAQYDLPVTKLEFVGTFTNLLYRARAGDRWYLLRVCSPGWRTDEDRFSEVMWLRYIHQSTDIVAPDPVAARDGSWWVEVSWKGLPDPLRCMVMTWLPGVRLIERMDEHHLEMMGDLFARLHETSLDFRPPEGFTQRKADRVLIRGEEDIILTDRCADAFTPRSREVFAQVRARVGAALARRYSQPGLRVIHHDLGPENIKVNRGGAYPLDFEDTVWGYPAQDIAMALHDVWLEVSQEQYDHLLAAFRRGYERRCPWPELSPDEIETFRAGRMIVVANWVARYEREYLQGFIERTNPLFERFLETGSIRKG